MTIVLIGAALYLLAAGLLVRVLAHNRQREAWPWLLPALAAVVSHVAVHLVTWRQLGQPDMHFFAALSLVGLGMAALTAAVGRFGRLAALGVVVFPVASATVIAYGLHGPRSATSLDWPLQLHAWLALLAYATLAVAALLALMLWAQERAMRRREFHRWLRALPPLVELETLLFRTIAAGFVLLSATLLTGIVFVEDLFAQHLIHKTVLSVLSWLAFGALLLGRWRWGWRGDIAVRWTLSATALLVLAYFGSKFVLELVLERG
ncbi:cytochrome C assembly family protein [Cognatilysobacter bugurensis]|uniref:Membrane protein n=1 Tax=Cognatilysobacter bugurensis TaxID=543356 RepID=A0A918SW47_9GAMM|nr:cytochrome c biogenesis protein CcsA [Lysobacter bugurensis]GHA74859.1 membrane protein [Lysobacter bugurensis]